MYSCAQETDVEEGLQKVQIKADPAYARMKAREAQVYLLSNGTNLCVFDELFFAFALARLYWFIFE